MAYSLKDLQDQIDALVLSVPDIAGIKSYEHDQTVASDHWQITHGFGSYFVEVNVHDGSNFEIVPADVQLVSNNQVDIFFSEAITGKARLIVKHS